MDDIPQTQQKALNILVVEDSPTQLEKLRFLLEGSGFSVVAATNGKEGLAAARANPIDLVISDIVMPEMDGYALCTALRAEQILRHVPVILLTSLSDPRDVIHGLESGADNFICKPYDDRALIARVHNVLTNQEIRKTTSSEMGINIFFAGQQFFITADRLQILDLLLSTYEVAIQQNRELLSAREELRSRNIVLEKKVRERTANLVAEMAERNGAEESLRESEAQYRAVMESANDAIIIADSAGMIEYWNPAAERMFGYSEREACGQPLAMLNPERLANRRFQDVISAWDGIDSGSTGTRVEMEGRRKDGSEFPLELSLSEWSTPAGRHFTGVIHDITARKAAEAEKTELEAQYRQAQKMEAVGRLAGGVAHDFNNMLAVISGYADLALMKLDPSGPMYADLKEVTKAANRSAELVRQLLAFARQQTIAPRVLDLNEAVEQMLKLLRRLIGEDIELVWKPGRDMSPVKMDPTQIDQLLANLTVNARDAIAGTGKVIIELGMVVFDDAYCAAHPGSAPGRYALLAVSDDGCGMDQETQGRIFEPFFTTKAQGQGTGLGLSTVYGIVKQNLGFIHVESDLGRGTTVGIYLPAHESAVGGDEITPLATDAAKGWETVLLVEDENALLGLCKRTLEHLGYTVLATASPMLAIELFKDHPGEIHLVLTDVVMPEMNGRILHQRLEELRPGLKCLFTSAYTSDVIAHRGVLSEDVNFLQKPYSWQSLAAKVREVLDAP